MISVLRLEAGRVRTKNDSRINLHFLSASLRRRHNAYLWIELRSISALLHFVRLVGCFSSFSSSYLSLACLLFLSLSLLSHLASPPSSMPMTGPALFSPVQSSLANSNSSGCPFLPELWKWMHVLRTYMCMIGRVSICPVCCRCCCLSQPPRVYYLYLVCKSKSHCVHKYIGKQRNIYG